MGLSCGALEPPTANGNRNGSVSSGRGKVLLQRREGAQEDGKPNSPFSVSVMTVTEKIPLNWNISF